MLLQDLDNPDYHPRTPPYPSAPDPVPPGPPAPPTPSPPPSPLLVGVGRKLQSLATENICLAGEYQLFSNAALQDTHYLLFTIAVIHFITNAIVFGFTNQRFALWREYEQDAR